MSGAAARRAPVRRGWAWRGFIRVALGLVLLAPVAGLYIGSVIEDSVTEPPERVVELRRPGQ